MQEDEAKKTTRKRRKKREKKKKRPVYKKITIIDMEMLENPHPLTHKETNINHALNIVAK